MNISEIIDSSIKASTNKCTNHQVNLKVVPSWNDEVKHDVLKCDMGRS